MIQGIVTLYKPSQGYGYITPSDSSAIEGDVLYFHVVDYPHNKPREGAEVSFQTGESKEGYRTVEVKRAPDPVSKAGDDFPSVSSLLSNTNNETGEKSKKRTSGGSKKRTRKIYRNDGTPSNPFKGNAGTKNELLNGQR